MQYIESLEQRRHEQMQRMDQLKGLLRESRQQQLRWMKAARLQKRRNHAANQVQRALEQFEKQLAQAQKIVAEVDRENDFLREKIRLLEEIPNKEEPAVVPLDQLTFELFLDGLEEDEEELEAKEA